MALTQLDKKAQYRQSSYCKFDLSIKKTVLTIVNIEMSLVNIKILQI